MALSISVEAAEEEAPKGFITFSPNQIPHIKASYEDYSFKFESKGYFVRIRPFVIYQGRYYGLKAIVQWLESNYPDVNYKWLFKRALQSIHFGFNLTQLPQNVADKIDFLGFRLVDLNFPPSWFELEEIELLEKGYEEKYMTLIHLPKANLIISFQDLYPYGYTVEHINSTYILIGDVKGKTDLYLDPITYSGDTITVIGGTEGSPLGFWDIWDADVNGLQALYIGDVGTDITLTTQIRPADDLALKIHFMLSGSDAGKNDHIDINGTDKDGGIQTETLETEGDGDWYTSKWFKTITDVDCIGFTDGTLQIIQRRWGVVYNEQNVQYSLDVKLVFGNGTVEGTTWFADTNMEIVFADGVLTASNQKLIHVKQYANFRLGELIDVTNRTAYKGCTIFNEESSYYSWVWNEGTMNFYASSFYASGYSGRTLVRNANRTWHCVFSDWFATKDYVNVYDVTMLNTYISSPTGDSLFENCYIMSDDAPSNYAVYISSEGVTIRDTTFLIRGPAYLGAHHGVSPSYFINVVSNEWKWWMFTESGEIYRQYELDLLATFKNGSSINGTSTGARVTIQYYGQGAGVNYNATLNQDGTINQTVLTKDFFNKTGGDNPYSYEPLNIRIWNMSGYQEYEKNFTISEKTSWKIALHESIETYECTALETNSTVAGEPAKFRSNWKELYDGPGLSHYLLCTNNSGSWLNTSWSSSWVDNYWAESTLTLNSTEALTIRFRFYVNDTAGNVYVSSNSSFTTPLIHIPVGPFVGVTHRVDYGLSLLVASPLIVHPTFNQFLENRVEIPLDLIILNREDRTREIQLSYSITSENGELIKEGELTAEIGARAQDPISLSFEVPFRKRENPKNFTMNLEANGKDPIQYQIQVSHDPWFPHLYNLAFIMAAVGIGCILYLGYKKVKRGEEK